MPRESQTNKPVDSLRMPGGLPSTAGFLKQTGCGDLIIEFYDFSETADSWFGNDVALLYTVRAANLGDLKSALEVRSGASVEITGLAQALAESFSNVMALIAWIKESGIPYSQSFDSQA